MESGNRSLADLASALSADLPAILFTGRAIGLQQTRALMDHLGWCDRVRRVLRVAQSEGRVRDGIDLDRVVTILADVCAGVVAAWQRSPPCSPVVECAEQISIVLGGLRVDRRVTGRPRRYP